MDHHQQEPSRDSLALARKHVRALTDGGVSREALLRALLEQEEANNHLPPLPSQAAPQQPQLKKSSSLSRTLSLSQTKTRSHWSFSTKDATNVDEVRPGSSDQLSTSTTHSGSRGSFLSTHTAATSLSSRSSTITQFPGTEVPTSKTSSASTRAYWCTSCDTEFKRKFDWKRHEDEFHERYKKYPCPDCNRVFWGANTFNQHHKTRHNCKTCPHADKVIKYTRKKRAWACGFCAAFLPSMDRYIDHIGLHYESGRTKAHWYHSNVIYGLLHQPGVNAAWKNIIGTRFSHIPKDQQPRYGWDLKTTGRKQGFLENETAGNLQDLLEFFNPTKDDPVKVARAAFDMADLTAASQVPGRTSLDVPDKTAAAAAATERHTQSTSAAPRREKSSSSATSSSTTLSSTVASSRRKPSPSPQTELAPPPIMKQRRITQWPGTSALDGQGDDVDTQMHDFDATAVPQPLFASSGLSPTQPQYNGHHHQQQQLHHHHHHHHPPPPSISISTASDPPPAYLTPTTPLPPTPNTPFPGAGNGLPRDTVVDLLQDYMSHDQIHALDGTEMDMQQQHMNDEPLCQHPPFGHYEDWNSICSTMVEDIASPRHNGPVLPLAPHEQQQQQQEQQQPRVRRSDFWAPPTTDEHESVYIDGVQACDLASLPPPPPLPNLDVGRRSDVWANSTNDYEGMGYEHEVAAPPPPSSNWL